MRNLIFVVLALALLVFGSCTSVENELGDVPGSRGGGIHRFYATTEQSAPETKVYADDKLRVLWNEGDLLTVFNKNTYNSKFQFVGEDGDNAGDFEDVTQSSGFVSGNPLSNSYAVYPYDKGNKINNDGNTITLTLPAEQQYREHSFGIGANTMAAVTDNIFLAFKNLGGYLQLRLYGDNVKVSSITIQGNNGEKIAGKASVAVGLGAMPTVTMDATAKETITLVCDPPVQLGPTAEQYTDFWFVIPPVTFSGGFTVTVTDELGAVFQKTTTKSLTISRSTIEWMAALEVTPNYDNVNVVFEDANFKAYCVENFDKNNDGDISIAEALAVTTISCSYKNIQSLLGIEYFINLDALWCTNNLLTSLDVSNNTALKYLSCYNNQLTSLDVSNNTALKYLSCYNNQLTSLNVSNNTSLTALYCYNNQLTSLDVSNIISLTILWCYDNQLTSLNVSHDTALEYLYCYNNQLTDLDVSKNTALTHLDCRGNHLASLNVNHNTALINLSCASNQLTSLDVSHNTALCSLDCFNNQLTSIDVSKNTILGMLGCSNNQLTSIELSNNTSLYYLSCYNNQLSSLDVSHDTALEYLYCGDNQLTSLILGDNTALIGLYCSNNQLMSLDVSNNLALTYLSCSYNQLMSLDLSHNTTLSSLSCHNNPNLSEIWLKTGQTITDFSYDTSVATIKYK